ncbi:endocuticle structural glycoprotein ABD-5-like [Culicoides brevitarsis]|uniref:endocuticle structural glycoprotein ABD-5-like n=1 Tax=Culicoides brevitarsis TaxID=469753 RepID=UPI00307CAE14
MKVLVICGLIFAVLVNESYGKPIGEDAIIVGYTNEANENGYSYSYETSDGSQQKQSGTINANGVLEVRGSYNYIGDDGVTYTVNYIADDKGYRVIGDHIPKGADGYLELTDNPGPIPPPLGIPPSAVLSLVG